MVNLTITTAALLMLLVPAVFVENNLSKKNNLLMQKTFEKFTNAQIILLFLSFFILTQSNLLNYETIDWDVNSYLASSAEIGRGNLPYEFQWESKSPLFYFVYYFVSKISAGSLLFFKILNDLLILLICLFMYLTIKTIKKMKSKLYVFPLLYLVSLLSIPWAHAEYSEYYCLFFLVTSNYFIVKEEKNQFYFYFSSLFLSLSSLLNVGTSVFLLAYLFYFYMSKKSLKESIVFITIFTVPHFLFLLLYFFKGLINTYLASILFIPLSYSQTDFSFVKEMFVFLRSISEFNVFLYLIALATMLQILFKFIHIIINNDYTQNLHFLFFSSLLICSILYFFVAAKGYNHHMIFFLYYFSFSIFFLDNSFINKLIYILMFAGILTISITNFQGSYDNLKNLDNLEEAYPLKNLSQEIDSYFDNEYTILALEHVLTLYYLDKPNATYIIHPLNHQEKFITDNLIKIGKISQYEISSIAIAAQPDVVICSDNFLKFNCEVTDYYKNYKELDTRKYLQSSVLNYYSNPYQKMRVFIKK